MKKKYKKIFSVALWTIAFVAFFLWLFALIYIFFFGGKATLHSFFPRFFTSEISETSISIVPEETGFSSTEIKNFHFWKVDPRTMSIRLFWKDTKNIPYGTLQRLVRSLKEQQKHPLLLMNAGMYHPGMIPVGLHVEHWKLLHAIDVGNGEGNFYVQPNGVFFVKKHGEAMIMESRNFDFFITKYTDLTLAVQSGPLLLYDRSIHPWLQPSSTSRYIRNAVWIDEDGYVYFVFSQKEVTLYELALFFKDTLHCTHALYLDWFVSGFRDTSHWFSSTNTYVWMIGVMK